MPGIFIARREGRSTSGRARRGRGGAVVGSGRRPDRGSRGHRAPGLRRRHGPGRAAPRPAACGPPRAPPSSRDGARSGNSMLSSSRVAAAERVWRSGPRAAAPAFDTARSTARWQACSTRSPRHPWPVEPSDDTAPRTAATGAAKTTTRKTRQGWVAPHTVIPDRRSPRRLDLAATEPRRLASVGIAPPPLYLRLEAAWSRRVRVWTPPWEPFRYVIRTRPPQSSVRIHGTEVPKPLTQDAAKASVTTCATAVPRTLPARRLTSAARATPRCHSGPGFFARRSTQSTEPERTAEQPRAEGSPPCQSRSPEPRALSARSRRRRRGRLRHPGRRDPARVRPAVRLDRIRHILVRHEQGAGHAATGYAQATGKVGVCMATSGPGRDQPGHADRRRLHGLGADRRDHRPGAQRGRSARTPSRRPTSAASRCRSPSTTTWSPTRRHPAGDRRGVPHRRRPAGPARCWSTSPRTCCRRRPTFDLAGRVDLPGYRPVHAAARQADPRGGPADRRARAARALRRRRRAQGAARGPSCAALAERTGIPVVTTLMARGAFPDSHRAAPGHAGHARHGRGGRRAAEVRPADRARRALRRPGDRQAVARSPRTPRSSTPTSTRPRSRKNRTADVPIVGDCRDVIAELIAAVAGRARRRAPGDYAAWWAQLDEWRTTVPARLRPSRTTARSPRSTSSSGSARSPGRRRSTSPASAAPDVGRAVHLVRAPGHWINSGGLGTMGYAVPAAMGAKVGRPDARSGPSTATAASR